VTNTANLELVRSPGADRVLDYTAGGAKADPNLYDVIFDAGGYMSLSDQRRALTPDGTAVVAGAGNRPTMIGIAGRMAAAIVMNKAGSRRFVSYLAHRTQEDLQTLAGMLEAASIRVVVDRSYDLADIADAVRYQETGQARGKVVVTVAADGS
jgi:NADPH:quinone reductase-like Zn-dependent oxidoreductase